MDTLLLVLLVLVAIALIVLIMLQQGKGADAGAAFGSGASATVFGSQGSGSFLTRATAVLATVFFVTSLSLAYLSGQKVTHTSVTETVVPPAVKQVGEPVTDVPALPAQPAPASDVPAPTE